MDSTNRIGKIRLYVDFLETQQLPMVIHHNTIVVLLCSHVHRVPVHRFVHFLMKVRFCHSIKIQGFNYCDIIAEILMELSIYLTISRPTRRTPKVSANYSQLKLSETII